MSSQPSNFCDNENIKSRMAKVFLDWTFMLQKLVRDSSGEKILNAISDASVVVAVKKRLGINFATNNKRILVEQNVFIKNAIWNNSNAVSEHTILVGNWPLHFGKKMLCNTSWNLQPHPGYFLNVLFHPHQRLF